MKTNLFDYVLPPASIAQRPLEKRDGARLLVLDRKTGHLEHSQVKNLGQWLLPNDLMVVNQTKVIPARLYATKPETGAKLEIFLLRPAYGEGADEWEVLIMPAKRVTGNLVLKLDPKGEAAVLENLGEGHFIVRFNRVGPFRAFLRKFGHVPLPPYIKRKDEAADRERYQTLFARKEGSVAAPTAGLHFTKALMEDLKKRGIRQSPLVLHVGLGTFQPMTSEEIEGHVMHPERYEIPAALVSAIQKTRAKNGRVVAIGTTVARALESAAGGADSPMESAQSNLGSRLVASTRIDGALETGANETRLFITPGYPFRAVDVLFTNFHQPKSTLLMLVCAFAGRERVLAAYEEALQQGYRFLSYGDAMLIL